MLLRTKNYKPLGFRRAYGLYSSSPWAFFFHIYSRYVRYVLQGSFKVLFYGLYIVFFVSTDILADETRDSKTKNMTYYRKHGPCFLFALLFVVYSIELWQQLVFCYSVRSMFPHWCVRSRFL